MLSLKLHFSKFWTFKYFCIAIYWPHNDHDASWQNTAHVNVSVANFTILHLFIVLLMTLTYAWRTNVWRLSLCSRNVVISDGDSFTSVNTFYNVLWPIRQIPFQHDQSMHNKFYNTLRQNLCFVLYYYQGCFSTHGNLREDLDAGIKCQIYDFFLSYCWFLIERTLEKKVYTFSNWISIIVYVCRIDIWYSFCRLYTQKR